jgi:hypothetical protein
MTRKRLIRLVAGVVAAVAFFVSWAAIAARPWETPRATLRDPRLAALTAREEGLNREAKKVERLVKERWAHYRHALKKRQHAILLARRRHARQLAKARLAAARVRIISSAPASAPASAPVVSGVSLPAVKPVTSTKSS